VRLPVVHLDGCRASDLALRLSADGARDTVSARVLAGMPLLGRFLCEQGPLDALERDAARGPTIEWNASTGCQRNRGCAYGVGVPGDKRPVCL